MSDDMEFRLASNSKSNLVCIRAMTWKVTDIKLKTTELIDVIVTGFLEKKEELSINLTVF